MKTHTTAIFIRPQWTQWTQKFSVYLNACNILIHLSLYAYNPGSNAINMSQSADNNKVYIDQQPKAVLSQNPIFTFLAIVTVCRLTHKFPTKMIRSKCDAWEGSKKEKGNIFNNQIEIRMKFFGQRRNELQHFCFAWIASVWANFVEY